MKWSRKNVLVTGITGFTGSRLAKKLVELGANVTGITRLERWDEPREEGVNLVKGDILDFFLVKRVLADYDIDICFHLAAQAIVGRALKSPVNAYQTNVIGTANMLEACRHTGIEAFLYVSTDKVYGEPDKLPITEDMPLKGLGIYESSKVAADQMARAYATTFDLPVTVSRACNIYGPGDTNPRIIPNTIRACLRGEPPVIYRGIGSTREYIYVDDAVEAYISLVENIEKTRGEAFNVGSGEVKKQEEVVEEIANHFGLKPVYAEPMPHMLREIKNQYLSSEKIRERTGWQSRVKFSEGIKMTIEWWKEKTKSKGTTS